MIVSNLMGGLVNQMFQFSCGRALSLRFEQEFYVAQDLFQKYPLHNGYELQDAFDLKTKIVSKKNLKDLFILVFKILCHRCIQVLRHFERKMIYAWNSFELQPSPKSLVCLQHLSC